MHGSRRVDPGGEVAVQRGERLARARGAGISSGPSNPANRSLLRPGPALVVRAHPAHELAVGRGRAPAVAEAALHDLVERARARRDVVVHDQAHEAVALDRERPVALLLDQMPEDLVAHLEQLLLAVGGLAQGEQPRPGREQPMTAQRRRHGRRP